MFIDVLIYITAGALLAASGLVWLLGHNQRKPRTKGQP